MGKLILKLKMTLPYTDTLEIENQILKDLDTNGFAIIDDRFDVYELDEKEDN